MKKIFLQLLIPSFAVVVRLKHSSLVVLIGAGLFLSCSKPGMPPTNRFATPPPPPSLSGQEFLFDSLTWIFLDGRFNAGADEIYLQTPARTDLFPSVIYSENINAEVLMKFDTASNWFDVTSVDVNDPSIPVQY